MENPKYLNLYASFHFLTDDPLVNIIITKLLRYTKYQIHLILRRRQQNNPLLKTMMQTSRCLQMSVTHSILFPPNNLKIFLRLQRAVVRKSCTAIYFVISSILPNYYWIMKDFFS